MFHDTYQCSNKVNVSSVKATFVRLDLRKQEIHNGKVSVKLHHLYNTTRLTESFAELCTEILMFLFDLCSEDISISTFNNAINSTCKIKLETMNILSASQTYETLCSG